MSRRLPQPVSPRAPQPRRRWRLAALVTAGVLMAAGSVVINMQVAAEHDRVLQLKRQLLAHTARIRELQSETVLRSRTALVQGWNTEKLHLEAPRARQYLQSPLQLASFAATPQAGAATPGFQLALATTGAPVAQPGQRAPVPAPVPALPQVVKAAWAPGTAAAPAPSPPVTEPR